jgi:hypothetical protein
MRRGIPNPWELFEPSTEYGRAAVAAMKRIHRTSYSLWLSEELAAPSHRDPLWLEMVKSEGERLNVEPRKAMDDV